VIIAQGPTELWEAAGPDGDPHTSNSKRSELAGNAASLELILMIVTLLKPRRAPVIHTKTWIDSSGAGRHISNLLHKKTIKQSYPHDPDLLSHIRWLWLNLPMVKQKIGWVKSHQDVNGQYDSLPRNAQLNILADALATEYAAKCKDSKYRPKGNPLFFPSCQ
jgi:hypothetical protein